MNNFEKSYQNLNKEQLQAVDSIYGPVLVIAGPGSGKTELLAVRVANILQKDDIPASSILCLTFTDTATLNMKERLVEMIGDVGYKVAIFTFHSFCKEIIARNPEYFYNGANFKPADEIVRTEIIQNILASLRYDDPLASKHPRLGFVYLKDVKQAISDIKEGGLTPEEFKNVLDYTEKEMEKIQPLIDEVFSKRVNNSTIHEVQKIIAKLRNFEKESSLPQFESFTKKIIDSLSKTLVGTDKEKRARISAWKSHHTKKNKGKRILKDYLYMEKQKSLAKVYALYKDEMYQRGLFDFSDMILDVIKVLEKESSLRYDLQERFQHIQVDEFQDTNGAQMRLLMTITADEPHNQPNVCVVGDDDQAIYRFQGAEIANILDFKNYFARVNIITLKNNYRSTRKILKVARKVITRGEERLENKLKEVQKDLVSVAGDGGKIVAKRFRTKEEEYSYVSREIKELIDHGTDPEEITVIGRTHKILKEITPYFFELGVPVYAERKENVLENELVIQIIKMIRFSTYLFEGDTKKAEHLLPDILSFPFWKIDRSKVWKLARRVKKEKISWFKAMENDPQLKNIVLFFDDLAKKTRTKPVEEVIDFAIGNRKDYFISPFKDFYFNKSQLKENPDEYFKFLSAIKKFLITLRKYRKGEFINCFEFLDFVDIHQENNIPINDTNPLITDKRSVSLITAHGAKGKEFQAVFVLNCTEEIWAKSKNNFKLSYPINLPFRRSAETVDDQLRLFYVCITRAKKILYLTSFKFKDSNRENSPLEFINHLRFKEGSLSITPKELETSLQSYYGPPFCKTEKKLLESVVSNYQLSVTGLNKFLDIIDYGPQAFFEDVILRFPKKKSANASFGTAIHATIKDIYLILKRDSLPSLKKILKIFEKYLQLENLSETDFKKYFQRGKDCLSIFYNENKDVFNVNDLIEKDFSNQGVVVGNQQLTGKIDKMTLNANKIIVTDFKTGRALDRWNETDSYKKIKAYKFKNQLIFYKLLVENSRDFSNYRVNQGVISFVEPNKDGNLIDLSFTISKDDVERMKKLILIIGQKIKNLDFPKVKIQQQSIKEIKKFENNLLNKKI